MRVINPKGLNGSSYLVFRGGSWYLGAEYLVISHRGSSDPGPRYDLGFRIACNGRKG